MAVNFTEQTPLLQQDQARYTIQEHQTENGANNDAEIGNATAGLVGDPEQTNSTTTVSAELKYIIIKSIPNCFSFLLQYCINAFSVFFVSRLGTDELAATSLAVTTYFISGPALFMGMATAIDTLCSQAYGAKQYKLVGLYFQRNVALSVVLFVPLMIVWINMDKILRLYVHDDKIINLTSQYIHVAIFEAPAFILYENGKRFIQAQGIFHATTYILVIVVPINLLLNYFLIINSTTAIGFMGAPISAVLSYWLLAILLFAYVVFVDGYQCWCKIDLRKIFSNLGQLIKLNVYGAVMVLSECLAFQLITIFASQINVLELAGQSVTFTISNYFFQIPFAIGVVASTRIGNYIGSKHKQNAKIATRTVYTIAISLGFTNCIVAILLRNKIAHYFANDDAKLEKIIAKSLIIVAIFQMLDCAFNVCSAAVLRAQGRQKIGGILSLLSYYVVGLVFEVYLGFVLDWRLFGLWAGLLVGMAFLSITQTFFVVKSNWDDIFEKSKHY